MGQHGDYHDLIVWQKAMDVVTAVYKMTDTFPKSEIYGLVSQMRRAAVSIPSNIAEGRRRGSDKEYIQFVRISFGSGAELETQIEIARRLQYLSDIQSTQILQALDEVMRILNKFTSNSN